MAIELKTLTILLIALTLILSFLMTTILAPSNNAFAQIQPDVYVGVDMAYGYGSASAKSLIDKISSYTNLFVVGASGSCYAGPLGEIFQYAYEKGLSFMSFQPVFYLPSSYNQSYYNST